LKMNCENSKLFECTDATHFLLNNRVGHTPPFLRQDELLYLVLLIMKNEIQNTASCGFMALHRLREPSDVRVISQLFAEELPSGDFLSFAQAHQFNSFVRNRKAMNFKCSPKALDVNLLTNIKHTALRRYQ